MRKNEIMTSTLQMARKFSNIFQYWQIVQTYFASHCHLVKMKTINNTFLLNEKYNIAQHHTVVCNKSIDLLSFNTLVAVLERKF